MGLGVGGLASVWGGHWEDWEEDAERGTWQVLTRFGIGSLHLTYRTEYESFKRQWCALSAGHSDSAVGP